MNAHSGRTHHRGGVKRILLVAIAVLTVLFVLVALLPTFINMGLARGVIERTLDDAVTGNATFKDIHTSWFGSQTLTGVTLSHESGQQVASVDATLDAGLLALVVGAVDVFDITLAGAAETDLREDGTLTLLEAAAPPVPSTEPLAKTYRIDMDNVDLTVHDEVTGRTMIVKPRHARTKVAPGGEIVTAIEAAVESGDVLSELSLNVQANGLPVMGNRNVQGGFLYVELRSDRLPMLLTDKVDHLSELNFVVESDELTELIAMRAGASVHARHGDGSSATPLDADLSARHWIASDGSVTPAAQTVSGHIRATQAPTALLQPFLADSGIVLERDVGPLADINITLPEQSGEPINATIDADLLDINLAGTMGEKVLNLDSATITAAVSPGLRQHYLKPINPILADIRHAEDRLVASLGPMVLPIDGDLSRLSGQLTLTIGEVQFDPGSMSLALLEAFNQADRNVTGRIDPIVATITDGVLTYDTFTLSIDKYTMNYRGTADLVNRTLDVRTEIPLAGLATSVRELRGYADQIVVPIVTRGTFDAPKTSIDPDFDLAKAAAEAGLRGGLGDLLKDSGLLQDDTGKDVGDLLDDILGGGKKKDDGRVP